MYLPHRIIFDAHAFWRRAQPLLEKELHSPLKIPLKMRLKMWRMGFLSESYVVYGLDRNNPKEYLTDAQRFLRTTRINGEFALGLDNKVFFSRLFPSWRSRTVLDYYMIKRGVVFQLAPEAPGGGADGVCELLQFKRKLILKPYHSGGGKDIRLLEWDEESGGFKINGVVHDRESFKGFLTKANGSLICEFVEQAEYSKRIFPGSVNTIRILTMWDDEIGEPFIAIAVHRFGSKATAPVDNWTQGGISARVDLETGVLGRGAAFPKTGRIEWLSCHPDTGEAIEGVAIPGWDAIREGALAFAREAPFFPYVGWDVIVTADGCKILEGNRFSDVNLLQIHGPLLRDERVRRFYEKHGILKR